MILEGRVAGPWAAELSRTWAKLAPGMGTRTLSIDLRNTTYADGQGILVLRRIYAQAAAKIVTSTPWTQYLAEEVTRATLMHHQEEI